MALGTLPYRFQITARAVTVHGIRLTLNIVDASGNVRVSGRTIDLGTNQDWDDIRSAASKEIGRAMAIDSGGALAAIDAVIAASGRFEA